VHKEIVAEQTPTEEVNEPEETEEIPRLPSGKYHIMTLI
jgi:hypothetical protein